MSEPSKDDLDELAFTNVKKLLKTYVDRPVGTDAVVETGLFLEMIARDCLGPYADERMEDRERKTMDLEAVTDAEDFLMPSTKHRMQELAQEDVPEEVVENLSR